MSLEWSTAIIQVIIDSPSTGELGTRVKTDELSLSAGAHRADDYVQFSVTDQKIRPTWRKPPSIAMSNIRTSLEFFLYVIYL